jgi:hypothetical protein
MIPLGMVAVLNERYLSSRPATLALQSLLNEQLPSGHAVHGRRPEGERDDDVGPELERVVWLRVPAEIQPGVNLRLHADVGSSSRRLPSCPPLNGH